MAKITYSSNQVITRNEARLLRVYIVRELGPTGIETGNVVIEGTAIVGHNNGSMFIEHNRVNYSETVSLASAVAFFGTGPVLAQLEQRILQRMQAMGLLPAGSIS